MVDGWEVKADESKIYYLIKEFKFKNFLESQNFVNKVGNIAEIEAVSYTHLTLPTNREV